MSKKEPAQGGKLRADGTRRVKAKDSDFIEDPIFGRVPPAPIDRDGYYIGDAPTAAESASTIGDAAAKAGDS